MKKLTILFSIALLWSIPHLQAQNTTPTTDLQATTTPASVPADSTKRIGWFNRFLNYFNDANKEKPQRKFDFSIIGGPHYSTDTKLGIGLVAAGLYRTDRNDSILPPSNISLFGDFSSVGFYLLGIRGTHLFPHDRYRLDYTLYGFYFPSKVWGIGYDEGNLDANESKMKRWQARIKVDFLFRLAPRFYMGPTASYDFVLAKEVERPELLHGMDRRTSNLGIGLTMVYDSRDVMTNPHRGIYASLSQHFRPAFLGNDYTFCTTDWRLNLYRKVWKGGLITTDFRGTLNFGDPSWGMMALLGSSNTMRGYYEGRYRDKHKMEGTIELRQHVWKRNGLVVWAGAGTVFPKFSALRFRKILPNYGLGYRWEFKKDVNVRLDYGFGKNGQSGFLFNINEAF